MAFLRLFGSEGGELGVHLGSTAAKVLQLVLGGDSEEMQHLRAALGMWKEPSPPLTDTAAVAPPSIYPPTAASEEEEQVWELLQQEPRQIRFFLLSR
jgi:hypothetical protein